MVSGQSGVQCWEPAGNGVLGGAVMRCGEEGRGRGGAG